MVLRRCGDFVAFDCLFLISAWISLLTSRMTAKRVLPCQMNLPVRFLNRVMFKQF